MKMKKLTFAQKKKIFAIVGITILGLAPILRVLSYVFS